VSCFENVRHIHKVTQRANGLIRFACPSICPHVSNWGPTERICVEFYDGNFYQYLSQKSRLC